MGQSLINFPLPFAAAESGLAWVAFDATYPRQKEHFCARAWVQCAPGLGWREVQLLDGAQLREAASARREAGHGVPEAGADGTEHRLSHRSLPTRSDKTRQRDGEGEH